MSQRPPADEREPIVITVHLRYEIDDAKLADFTEYGRRWIRRYERRFLTPVFE